MSDDAIKDCEEAYEQGKIDGKQSSANWEAIADGLFEACSELGRVNDDTVDVTEREWINAQDGYSQALASYRKAKGE